MTWDEVVEALALAAVYDQRKADALDAKAWLLVATDHRWTAPAVERVIREHYGSGAARSRIDPATITDRLRAVRRAAAASFEAPRIPADLPTVDYPPWLRGQLAAHVDAEVEQWAATGAEPVGALPVAPARVRTPRQLEAIAPARLRSAVAAGVRRLTGRRVVLNPDTRVTARAELDRARAAAAALAAEPATTTDP